MEDDELQTAVDNAVLDDEEIIDDPDNEQEDLEDEDLSEDEDIDSGDDEEDSEELDDKPKGKTPATAVEDEDLEDEDDDPSLDYAKPNFNVGSGVTEQKAFDIRNLPRDPDTGLIDPEVANKAIQDHYAQQAQASSATAKEDAETKQLLVSQWQRTLEKFPYLKKNKELLSLVREKHMNSIGDDLSKYQTPFQAARAIDRMYKKATKNGAKSQKSRSKVVKMTRTERNSGKPTNTQMSSYEKAKKLSMSQDPAKAKIGRLQLVRIRQKARKAAR